MKARLRKGHEARITFWDHAEDPSGNVEPIECVVRGLVISAKGLIYEIEVWSLPKDPVANVENRRAFKILKSAIIESVILVEKEKDSGPKFGTCE